MFKVIFECGIFIINISKYLKSKKNLNIFEKAVQKSTKIVLFSMSDGFFGPGGPQKPKINKSFLIPEGHIYIFVPKPINQSLNLNKKKLQVWQVFTQTQGCRKHLAK